MSKKIGLLVSADWHAGAAGGVLAPETTLFYKGEGDKDTTITKNPEGFQERIWFHSQNIMTAVDRRVAGQDFDLVFAQVGDAVHGSHFQETMMASRPSHQVAIAYTYFNEFHKRLGFSKFLTASGTEIHVGQEGDGENLLADRVKFEAKIDTRFGWIVRQNIGGVFIEFAHHRASVGRGDTRGNPGRAYLLRAMADDTDMHGRRPADLYIGAHVHDPVNVEAEIYRGGRPYKSRLLICPPMCAPNCYSVGRTRSRSYFVNGMYWIVINNGRIESIEEFFKIYDNTTSGAWFIDSPASSFGGSTYTGKYCTGDEQAETPVIQRPPKSV